MLTGNQIREKFLAYFESKGHTRVSSSSLVPHNDPTLLFTNAGMNQFKDIFLGLEKRPYSRATTSQKCVRAGGKHNDLDTVGRTARHHTFFEMLGNFSFGDYFKRDAIAYAWEFLTVEMGLPVEKLYATIYQDDDESYQLWQELTPLPAERIMRLGEKDNFWSMGDTGPCGPCSELHIDRGERFSCGPDCGIGKCDCDRFLEIWNLVFMQYNRSADGSMTPLPRPSIDTGMGLERITSIVQEVDSNYDTDLLKKIILSIEEISGQSYHKDQRGFPFRVIADHTRSCSFLISDGVMPGNEGRGYVLRRILRRAVRFGKVLGIDRPFIYQLVPVVIQLMQAAYPEIAEKADYVAKVIKNEEERFHETLNDGIKLAQDIVTNVKFAGHDIIPGKEIFRLYDTFGFPLDLTQDIAEEAGLKVDLPGFNIAMEEQRHRAKAARQEVRAWDLAMTVTNLAGELPATIFTGYETLAQKAQIQILIKDGESVNEVDEGDEVCLLVDKTPFYAEGGGQIGDQGEAVGSRGKLLITEVKKLPDGKIVHMGIIQGTLSNTEKLSMLVDRSKRLSTARNHTATHLLQQALRIVLGDHVHQAGSVVETDRLRFDFTHFTALTEEELQQIEDIVNAKILEAMDVTRQEMAVDQAKAMGATALFGEKYGDIVCVVKIEDFSMELCGGTHMPNTSQIGLFKIVSEGAVGAGVRRIEAVTGQGIRAYLAEKDRIIAEITGLLKSPAQEAGRRIQSLLEELKQKDKKLDQMEALTAKSQVEDLVSQAIQIKGVPVLISRVQANDIETLRNMADMFREKLESGIVVLGSAKDEKVNFIVAVTKDLAGKAAHAGNIIREVAKVAGGGGGGRPDLAQAGGKDPGRLDEALSEARKIIENQMQ